MVHLTKYKTKNTHKNFNRYTIDFKVIYADNLTYNLNDIITLACVDQSQQQRSTRGPI